MWHGGKVYMKKLNKFAMSALLVALAYVLSFVKILHLPFGGSITLFSMLFISLPAYFFGISYGFMASVTYSLLQLVVDPYIVHPLQLIMDYTVAFSCFGVVGFFRHQKNGLQVGFVVACIIRFVSSSISGYVFFKEYAPESWNPLVYTVVYNGSYIFIECVMSLIFVSVRQVNNLIERIRKKADKL